MATGLVEGALVGQLLSSLVTAIQQARDSKESLIVLQQRVQRLQPLLETLERDAPKSAQAAYYNRWRGDLRNELQKAHNHVVSKSRTRTIIERMWSKGELDRINNRISNLLSEAPAVNLPRQEELHRQQIELLESGLERQIELSRQFKKVFVDPSPRVREGGIRWLVWYRWWQNADNNAGGGSSSSTPADWKSHWNRACNVPDPPRVTFGGDAVADNQIEEILHVETQYRKWIVMWGMGGVGKTCAALRLFHSPFIQQHFTGGTYWVTVSKDGRPYSILRMVYEEIQKKRSRPFGFSWDLRNSFPSDLAAAQDEVKELLDREKVLLVLDDVWESATLQALDVVSEAKKGVILITTRDKGILNFDAKDEDRLKKIAKCAKVVEIPRLSTDHSWQLFCWHAFDVYSKSVPRELSDVAKNVAEECKGLPLALKVIGSTMGSIYLSGEDVRLGRSLEKEWRKALDQLRRASKEGVWRRVIERGRKGNSNHHVDDDAGLYDRLQWSLDNLLEDSRLKDCFSYFAAYPEDYPIPVEELLRMWAAEGLCREDEGFELLGNLLAKSVVELAHDGQTCKIHDVMRDLLRLNVKYDAEKEISVSSRAFLCEPGSDFIAFPQNWTDPDVQLSAKRLSLRNNFLGELPVRLNAPDLLVLMLSRTYVPSLPPSFFEKLSNLRVLDLSTTFIEEVPGSVLQNLNQLVLLDLRDCRWLKKISDKLESLEHLEILLLAGSTSLRRLPRMKGLAKLHTLSVNLWAHSSLIKSLVDSITFRCTTPDMLQLHSLRRVDMIGGSRVRESCYRPLLNMSSLSVLEELSLTNFQNFPAGLLKLRSLRVLRIERSSVAYDAVMMPALDELPLLEELSIVDCLAAIPKSFGRRGAFPSLRKLRLHGVYGVHGVSGQNYAEDRDAALALLALLLGEKRIS